MYYNTNQDLAVLNLTMRVNFTLPRSRDSILLSLNAVLFQFQFKQIHSFQIAASDAQQHHRRQRDAEISHSFATRDFEPAWYATNPHLQTIVGVFARHETSYASNLKALLNKSFFQEDDPSAHPIKSFQWDERVRMITQDGDFFDVDYNYVDKNKSKSTRNNNNNNYEDEEKEEVRPLVLIVHGLQSNSDSPLVKDMTNAFNAIGMDAACINFRGCSGEINKATPLGYHLSFTDDLQQMVEHISQTFPMRPIYLSGFSLGANVVTKFLADIGTDANKKYNICGAAVNAVPFDLVKVAPNLSDPGFTKIVYGNSLCQSLKGRTQEMNIGACEEQGLFSNKAFEAVETIREYDDLVVCSFYADFDNVLDYYAKSSTWSILDQVSVPQLIVQALDDPFFQGNIKPENDPSMPLRIHYTKHGGHCGYVFQSDKGQHCQTSWMPTEMARFLDHVHQEQQQTSSTWTANNDLLVTVKSN